MNIDLSQVTEMKDILGHKAKTLVEGYLSDTRELLAQIDVARASGNEADIIGCVHSLKSSSFQVGAQRIMEQSALIENFLRDNIESIDALHMQSRLDYMIKTLRTYYALFEAEIFNHL